MAKTKITLFGGTFDPIHIGHTTVADAACESIGAEKVVFIPAKRSPLKHLFPHASDEDRYAMTALAVSDNEKSAVSDYELKKSQPSYTLETVRYFQGHYGSDAGLYWLVGADGVDDLPHWHGIVELLDECNLSVMYRGGFERPDFAKFVGLWGGERVTKLERNVIKTPLIETSSTEIRSRIAAGCDVIDMLHPAVADYIQKHNLYQSKTKS